RREALEQASLAHERRELLEREQAERKRAEFAEERQRRLSTQTLAGIGDAVIATDEHGRVTFMNPVAEQLTGCSLMNAKESSLGEVFKIVNEKTGQAMDSPLETVLREGVVAGLSNHTMLIARDGRR